MGVVLSITFYANKVHEVAPLLLEQVLATLEAVEQEVARPRREVIRVVVSRAVELQCYVSVDSNREVVVEHIQWLIKSQLAK